MTVKLHVPAGMAHGDVVEKLRKAVYQPGGTTCPTCTQHAQVYRRKINSGMAVSLVRLHARSQPGEWVHVPTVLGRRSAEEGKLAYWGLIEEEKDRRPDGGRAGYWRLTDRGRFFARGLIAVPKYALVYDGRCLGLDDSEEVRIKDCLGDNFDYDELMGGG